MDAIAGLVRLHGPGALREDRSCWGRCCVLGGARDEVVPPHAHQTMLGLLSAEPCTEVVYPDGWHLLLRDLQRQAVWDDILAWIDGAPLPSGLAEPCSDSLRLAARAPG